MDDLITRAEAETMVSRFKRNPNTTEAVLENMKKANKSMQILGRENCSEHKCTRVAHRCTAYIY